MSYNFALRSRQYILSLISCWFDFLPHFLVILILCSDLFWIWLSRQYIVCLRAGSSVQPRSLSTTKASCNIDSNVTDSVIILTAVKSQMRATQTVTCFVRTSYWRHYPNRPAPTNHRSSKRSILDKWFRLISFYQLLYIVFWVRSFPGDPRHICACRNVCSILWRTNRVGPILWYFQHPE